LIRPGTRIFLDLLGRSMEAWGDWSLLELLEGFLVLEYLLYD
jgi:hypothetical protein